VGAIVTGVKDFDDMLTAKVANASAAAQQLGIKIGITGAEAIELLR